MDNSKSEIESLKRALYERNARHRAWRLRFAWFILISSILGVVFLFYLAGDVYRSGEKMQGNDNVEISKLRSQLEILNNRVTRTDDLVKALAKPDPAAPITLEQQKLNSQMNSLDERLNKIESAILESPERALSIPLLRKDIGESAKRMEEYRAASQSDIARLYEQQRWMLGGIGTVLLAVIGGAITIIFRSLPKVKTGDA